MLKRRDMSRTLAKSLRRFKRRSEKRIRITWHNRLLKTLFAGLEKLSEARRALLVIGSVKRERGILASTSR